MSDPAALPADPPRRLAGFRLVSLWTLVSRIVGFARDSAMAAAFGLGEILDAFTLAFRIPNLARSLFGEGALATAFLPAFIAERDQRGAEAAQRLTTAVCVRLLVILSALVAAAELILAAARWLRPAPPAAYADRLLTLLAIMLPYLVLICLAALLSAVLQAQRRFGWPAALPALLNLWWLAATGLAAWWTTDGEQRIRWIAASLVIGGGLQLAAPALVLRRLGWGIDPRWRESRREANAVFRAMLPTVLATTVAQFNTVLDTLLAWWLAAPRESGGEPWIESGTAAALYFAQRLYQFPLGLIGVAVATVLYPVLSARAGRNDHDGLRDDLTHGLRVALSLAIPASAGLVLLAGPINRFLFLHGRFDADDALLTSRITAIYGSVVWAAVALLLVQRGFFAVGDRQTPLKTGLASVLVNVALTAVGVWLGRGVGLAMATAGSLVFHLGLSLHVMRRHRVGLAWGPFGSSLARTLGATAAMSAACLLLRQVPGVEESRTWGLVLPLAGGLATFAGTAWLVGLHEPWELLRGRRAVAVRVDGDPSGK
ncbi:MAG: murein biosynthesis integral membrane protein MurJ [Planctomyces sp.]|nr:murein biosynthesis integral membrane protein MurJ [Planctomyces sp.]